ncbi:Magnesium-dependent phosphatase 1 [Phytophthora nicotianae]|uniref:Magnesium-dependent phosphatase 1 n=1 Tax=Phytophthora nicotianae TaxID=4792 RepID=A0A0W8D628_PHYNI|nr:Magnesium-dependent phosphatase 1 [Phytophthora nicotianae]
MSPSIAVPTPSSMSYRFLGNSGLLVSKLGLGSWMEYGETKSAELWYEIMKTAYEHGINFFDNADSYGMGLGEEYTGTAIKMGINDGTWKREDLVIATKLGMGTKGFHGGSGPNDQGLARKHIVEGLKASLKRMNLDYVDVLYCIRPDPYTPVEETVRAMNYVIERGWAFYWERATCRRGAWVSLPELAIAWCMSNENVSSVLIAARNLAQLKQNLKALSVVEKVTPEVKAKIESLVPFVPEVAKPDGTEKRRTKFL